MRAQPLGRNQAGAPNTIAYPRAALKVGFTGRTRAAGIESAVWLPLACDPDVHRKHDVPKPYDISFVGRRCPGPRDELLELIRRQIADHFIGQAFFDDMARIYSASRIVFNRSIGNDVNMRVFEALSCGSLLVTNDLADNGQAELFQDGTHLATYRDAGEMLEKVHHYLKHADRREEIAAAGRAEALARHTYRHRMQRLLAECEAGLARRVVAVGDVGSNGLHGNGAVEGGRDGFPPRVSACPGLTSIIVPCWNQLEFTRECLRALFRHTMAPWELIVVDNGSADATGEFLAGVQVGGRVPVTIVRNARNLGFPAAINQGLRVARGEFLVLLNNDAVVTEAWLEHLIGLTAARLETIDDASWKGGEGVILAEGSDHTAGEAGHGIGEDPSSARATQPGNGPAIARQAVIGLVGPMSNYASPPQLVEGVPYRDLDEMPAFARRWRDEHHGQWFTVGKLSGFCLLMTRAVYESVGGLDERFGLGFFDDDDLAERARRAGFELAVAHDVFVHHFGSRSFAGGGIDAGRLLDENARKFAEKWGRDVPQGRRVALNPWGGSARPPMKTDGPCPQMDADGRRWEAAIATARSQAGDVSHLLGPSAIAGPSASSEIATPVHHPLDLRPSAPICGYPSHSPRSRRPRPKVSLTMIVRDEEKNLPHCLESVRGIFDEIVVVDTGSVDRTRDIAREFGARVFDFVWVDDFAAARNAALARATGDYAFWLDADDIVEPPEREKLIALLEGLESPSRVGRAFEPDAVGSGRTGAAGVRLESPTDAGPAAYVVRCACDPGEDGSGGQTVVDHIRLFPVREAIRWAYRVHEQILPALRRAHIPVRWTDLVVRHTGYVNLAVRARKLMRDSRILLEEVEEWPDEPFLLFNLGAIAVERQDWHGALGYLRRSLAQSAPSDSITRKLFALIARSHQMLGDLGAALATCHDGLELDPDDAELWFRKAVVHRQLGQPAEAEAGWRRVLGLRRPERFCSVDQGIYGHLTRRNLAALAAERGDRDEEMRHWLAVLNECPGDPEAMAKLRPPVLAEAAR